MKVTFFFFSPEYILAHNISVPVIRTENWTWLPSEEQQSAKASQSSQPEECMSLTDCQERLTAAGSTAAGSNNFDFFFISCAHSVSTWNWSACYGEPQVAQLLVQKTMVPLYLQCIVSAQNSPVVLESPKETILQNSLLTFSRSEICSFFFSFFLCSGKACSSKSVFTVVSLHRFSQESKEDTFFFKSILLKLYRRTVSIYKYRNPCA